MSGGVGGYLFGKSPKVVAEPPPAPQPAITGAQQGVQNSLASILGPLISSSVTPGGLFPGTSYSGQNAGTQFAAPVTGQQNDLISAIVNAAAGGQSAQTSGAAQTTLQGLFNQKPMDWTQAFNSIAQPLQQQFSSQTIPAIMAAAATSAGGKMQGGNTGINHAIDQATQNLTSSESNAASQLAYQSNQASVQNILSALGLAPSLTASPINNLGSALGAATLPQTTQQTQLSGQEQAFQQQMQNFLSLLGVGSGFGTATDVAFPKGDTVVNPGQEGLVNQLLVAVAGNAGKMIGASDRRLKEDIKLVGQKNGFNIYQFKYIGLPDTYEGVMADEVKQTRPDAVRTSWGYDVVNYSALGLEMKKVA